MHNGSFNVFFLSSTLKNCLKSQKKYKLYRNLQKQKSIKFFIFHANVSFNQKMKLIQKTNGDEGQVEKYRLALYHFRMSKAWLEIFKNHIIKGCTFHFCQVFCNHKNQGILCYHEILDTSGFAPSRQRLTPLSGGRKGLRPFQTSMYTIF